jgi:HPt (histidine-containing phosphotransfer) domain-containing protein
VLLNRMNRPPPGFHLGISYGEVGKIDIKKSGKVTKNRETESVSPARKDSPVSNAFALPGPEVPVVDESRLMAEFGGDAEILAELRDLFMEHVPPLFQEIEAAVEAGQAEAIAAHTHSLKGACSTYGAPRLAMVCKEAELAARAGEVQVVQDHMEDLRREFEQVCQAIGGISVPTA